MIDKLRNTCILLSTVLLLFSCGDSSKITEGTIQYAVDYPAQKKNLFLYNILPKDMKMRFKDGKMQSLIQKVDVKNALFVDCNKKEVAAYFQYGPDVFNVKLNTSDIDKMLSDQKEYKVVFKKEEKDILGFTAKKAIATCITDPKDRIELWYTEEIELKNSNWYNPFKDVPGVLLEYAIDRYGVRMVFKAKKFDETPVADKDLELPKSGVQKSYIEYNNYLNGFFKPFEK